MQIRERGLDDREYAAFIRDCITAARDANCRVLVNDRVDLALATGADGVHLRETSVPLTALRDALRAKLLIGRSVHDATTAATARTADYMIAGSVFATESKPGTAATLGLRGLRAVVDTAQGRPVWAIGGIGVEQIAAVKASGAQGIAAIGAFMPVAGKDIAWQVRQRAEVLRFSLDRRG